jgi:integration host factor subunit alpha
MCNIVNSHTQEKEHSMTKADIAARIQDETGLTKKDSAELLESVFEIMKATLESGDTLKISGFGSFIVKQKADRRGRNPQTGDAITIEARRVLTFKPSTLLRQALNS